MDFYTLKNAFLVGVFMAFMIGPVFFMLLKTSILKGIRASIAFDFGVVLGDVIFILIAYFGSRSLLEKIKDDPRLFLFGGLVLVVYGIISYLDKNSKKEFDQGKVKISKTNNYLKLFLNGFLLNFINVGVLAGWLGIMVVVGPTLNMDPTAIFWYFVTVVFGYCFMDLLKILLAKKLKRKLTPLVVYKIKRGMGVLLIVFGLFFILKGIIPREKINTIIEKMDLSKILKN